MSSKGRDRQGQEEVREGEARHARHGPVTVSRYRRDPQALLNRLRRIEGQVRGIQRMVAADRYCVDILLQLSAVRAAIDQVGLQLLEDHVRGCVSGAIRNGNGDAAIEEMLDVVKRFLG